MNSNAVLLVVIAVLGLAVVGWALYRQTRWQPLRTNRPYQTPIVLAGLGAVLVGSSSSQLPVGWHLGAREVGLEAVELVVAVALGALLGRLTQVGLRQGRPAVRLEGAGAIVWASIIASRIGLNFAGPALHAPLLGLPGTAMLAFAVVRLVQLLVVRAEVRAIGTTPETLVGVEALR